MALGLMNTNRRLFIMEGVFVLFGANKSIEANNAKGTTDPRVGCSYQSNFFRSYTILDQISASES